ncbi:MAG: hypothetical protein GX958_06570 [Desulfitobacterium sp.]|nr:hypothetical protein [Desulfitobacterium sp.]
MGKKSRLLVLLTLFVCLSFGLFFVNTTSMNAYPDYGHACSECHDNYPDQEPPADEPAGETPATTPDPGDQEPVGDEPTDEPEEHQSMSPVIVIGGVVVVLGVIYILAIRKK